MNFVEELRWRGMLQDIMPGTEELLIKEQVTAYLGIDPTADSLHIGHLCGVMILRHFQRCGHKPLALIGGATGMIGDPSGKSAERNLLDEETLRHNQACIKNQLAKFLDFESDVPNRAELVNNYDWMKDFTFLDFVREVGKHITVNYMMAKDSVKRRLNGEARDGLSFTEFTYQLLQGYDFLHLYETKGCKLQMGGSDQWGNITTGLDLIKKKTVTDGNGSTVQITYSDEDIKKMTKGTFGFYQNAQLRAFTREEVQDMDANTYLKYMDSFLIGNAMVDYCILQDSGVTLKTEYDKKAANDTTVAAMTMKDYLANYRNQYLNDSLWGPIRNEEGLKVTLNRAIRYDIGSFNTMYKNTVIGDDEKKMEKVLSNLVQTMEDEQGVTFTYKKNYGTYENSQGRSTSGWLVEFTKK